MADRTIYYSWYNMMRRCHDASNEKYINYGGRGIRVRAHWQIYENFKSDMQDSWKPELTLDRINVDGDYCKENCRWVDQKTQQNNRTNNHKVSYAGASHTIPEWARIMGMKRGTLSARYYKHKWPIGRCLTEPVRGVL